MTKYFLKRSYSTIVVNNVKELNKKIKEGYKFIKAEESKPKKTASTKKTSNKK